MGYRFTDEQLRAFRKERTEQDFESYRKAGVSFYRWLGGDCPARGHNLMHQKVCSIDDPDAIFENDGNGNPVRVQRTPEMPKGSPGDCEDFCRCCTVIFDPKIDWA